MTLRRSRIGLVTEFLLVRKKWWLAPILVFMVLVSLLIFLSQSPTLTPLLYPLF
jgi:hypothetical protein